MYSVYSAVTFVIIINGHVHASLIQVPPSPTFSPTPNPVPRLPSIDDIFHDGKDHPCYRDCNGPSMTCYYHFHVEWYQSMSKACYDCPFNITDCYRKDCVMGNGVKRPVTVINRKMPGPAIEVCQNDRIVVDVENSLMASGTTIHWHGMHQKETPFMDGAPYVTQCPIQPETTFRYEFTAIQSGTYFWHSHTGLQRADGAAGALVIRQNKSQDPHGTFYDFDKSEHIMLITDWIDKLSLGMFTEIYHSSGDNRPTSLLINGVGRFLLAKKGSEETAMMRAPRFEVVKGKRFRFRLINAEFLNCPVEMSVDGHNITVIASDGSDLEPVTASSLVSYAGERFDFIINATKNVDNYWIRVRGLMACSNVLGARQVGVLHYKGAKDAEPPGNLTWDELHNDGLQINSVNQGEEKNFTKTISKLKSLRGYDDSLKPVPDYKFYISYDLYAKDNTQFFKFPYYGYHQVNAEFKVFSPQLNHISMRLPTSPLLVSRPSTDFFCNETTIRDSCKEDYCRCPHVLAVKLNSVVEGILIDEGEPLDANHPFHLHGFSFRVVDSRRLDSQTTVEKVKSFDEAGLMTRNLKNPPIKDTVSVPDGGYTIIRFKADNPGYWLFHCHIEFHAEVGMALVFKIGEHEDMKPVPDEFPTCGSFTNSVFKSGRPDIVKDIKNVEGDLFIKKV